MSYIVASSKDEQEVWINSKHPASLVRILLHLPLILVAILFIYYLSFAPNWSPDLLIITVTLSALYGLILATQVGTHRLNFTVVYGTYLIISHLGLAVSDYFIPGSLQAFATKAGLMSYHLQWYYSESRTYAIVLSGLGICAFFLGSGLLGGRILTKQRQTVSIINWQLHGNQPIFKIGVLLLIFSTIYLIGAFLTNSLPLFDTYSNYVTKLSELPSYPLFLVMISTGLTFMVATGSAKQIWKWIIFFIIPASLLLITGNRGEIFYALASSVAIVAIRGFRMNYRVVSIIAIAFFIVIPLVRDIRQTALNQLNSSEISINLTDPFVEMGYQLRPLMETIGWITEGEPFANGGTYLLPIQRLIGLAVPFIERPPIEGHFDIKGRLPAQGYTVVAEAYFNFGIAGVVIVLGSIGLFFAFSNKPETSEKLALSGAIAAILINNLRNDFLFVPGQIVIVLLLIFIARLLSNRQINEVKDT